MKQSKARIIQEYGSFSGVSHVHGIDYDGRYVWLATGDRLQALDPHSGEIQRAIDIPAHAGTAFDGKHLYQIAEKIIRKVDPQTGKVLATIPAPGDGGNSGMAWAEGSLWVAEYRERKIHRIDPETGKVLHTLASNRFVTGVTWFDDELWHGTWENEHSELRHLDADTGEVLESIDIPAGINVSGLTSDGKDRFYCGGGSTGKVRAVARHG